MATMATMETMETMEAIMGVDPVATKDVLQDQTSPPLSPWNPLRRERLRVKEAEDLHRLHFAISHVGRPMLPPFDLLSQEVHLRQVGHRWARIWRQWEGNTRGKSRPRHRPQHPQHAKPDLQKSNRTFVHRVIEAFTNSNSWSDMIAWFTLISAPLCAPHVTSRLAPSRTCRFISRPGNISIGWRLCSKQVKEGHTGAARDRSRRLLLYWMCVHSFLSLLYLDVCMFLTSFFEGVEHETLPIMPAH